MSKNNPWIFGLIIISVFVYLAWNNFELPTIFFGKTKVTIGKIIDIKIGYAYRGQGYIQNVKYYYIANDKVYYNFKKVDRRYGQQQIGNRVEVVYSERNPEKMKVNGFYNDFINSNGERFISNKKVGYSEIVLTNGIFTFKKFGFNGKIVDEFRGEYKYEKDTLLLNSFANKVFRHFLIVDTLSYRQLIDNQTKMIYKKLKSASNTQ